MLKLVTLYQEDRNIQPAEEVIAQLKSKVPCVTKNVGFLGWTYEVSAQRVLVHLRILQICIGDKITQTLNPTMKFNLGKQ